MKPFEDKVVGHSQPVNQDFKEKKENCTKPGLGQIN